MVYQEKIRKFNAEINALNAEFHNKNKPVYDKQREFVSKQARKKIREIFAQYELKEKQVLKPITDLDKWKQKEIIAIYNAFDKRIKKAANPEKTALEEQKNNEIVKIERQYQEKYALYQKNYKAVIAERDKIMSVVSKNEQEKLQQINSEFYNKKKAFEEQLLASKTEEKKQIEEPYLKAQDEVKLAREQYQKEDQALSMQYNNLLNEHRELNYEINTLTYALNKAKSNKA